MTQKKERVVVLGASPNPERYSYKAVCMLLEHGHEVVPVHPVADKIEDLPVVAKLNQVTGRVDTLTLYLSADALTALENDIINLKPGRVIFNPGTENQTLMENLRQKGLKVVQACTLVLLRTGQF
ncbi:MAG TPA: CoA-binding protein [Candidatus Rifleibacterium sp.]|nr:CoA-binding protein [Candidatus Rifleibacterium sp.]HPT48098.1 CoA-binding protein [Candidatus Rifleibacterium sp.]